MGMGLSRSYDLNEHKVCIYNTIEGQEKIKINKEILECPKKCLNKSFFNFLLTLHS